MSRTSPKPRKAAAAPITLTAPWATVLLALLVIVFFHALTLGGMTFVSPDATQPAGFVRIGEQSLYGDKIYPLWNPFVFLGMPSFASGGYNPLIYPPDWPLALLARVVPLPDMTWMLLYYLLGGVFFFALAREWGARAEGALLGAVAFVFAPNLIAVGSHGHGSQLVGSAYLPLQLWLASRWMRRGGAHHLGWLALAGGFQMLRGHAQIAFYTWFAVGLYLLVEVLVARPGSEAVPPAPRALRLRRLLGVAAAMALAFGLAGFYNLPLRDYAQYSIRGGGADGGVGMEYATAWSMALYELPSVVVPGWVGFGGNTYWGGMPFTDYPNAYVGMITVVLALLAFGAGGAPRLFALVLAGVALLISLGRYGPIYGFLYDHLPLFNKFRVPVMIVLLFQLAAALGLAWGWTTALGSAGAAPTPRRSRRLLWVAALLGVALLLGAGDTLRGGYVGFAQAQRPDLPPQLFDEAFRRFSGDLMRVALLGLLAIGAALLAMKHRLSAALASVAVLALLLVELWPVSGGVMLPVIGPRVTATLETGNDAVVEFLTRAAAPGTARVLPLVEYQSNRFAGFGVSSLGGYHAAKPRLFQDLVDRGIVQIQGGRVLDVHPQWLRLLNIRYLVAPQRLGGPDWLPAFVGLSNYGRPDQVDSAFVYEYAPGLPRATVVGDWRVAAGAATLDSIHTGATDVATTTWLERDPGVARAAVPGASARITRYRLNDLEIEVESPAPALLRLADLWYPDWKATVDGRPAEILKADYLLRAVVVPAGRHRVEFRYVSAPVRNGMVLSLASLAAILILLAYGWFAARRASPAAAS